MKAVVLQGPGELVVETSVPEPTATTDAVVEVDWCGICGTDRHVFLGEYGDRRYPRVLGHEIAGRVAHDPTGGLPEGTAVAVDINITCGRCAACLRGASMTCPQLRQVGVHRDGAFARFVAVPADRLAPLPSGVGVREGALFEPLACVVHAQDRLVWPVDASVLVIGAGPTGLLHAQVARTRVAGRVAVVDTAEPRLELASSLPGLDVRHATTLADDTFDVVIDAAGTASSIDRALDLVAPGGQVLMFGIPGPEVAAKVHPHRIVTQEVSIVGSNGATHAAWASVGTLVSSGAVRLGALVADEVDLMQAVDIIAGSDDRPRAGKVLVGVGGHR